MGSTAAAFGKTVSRSGLQKNDNSGNKYGTTEKNKVALETFGLKKTVGINIGLPYVIDLKDALSIAIRNYPAIQSSKYSYIASIYGKDESLYDYYPQVSVNASFNKNTVMSVSSQSLFLPPTFVNNGGINYAINTYQASLDASYLIYSFGSRHYSFMQSFYGMKISEYAYGQETNSDLYNVVFNFAQYFENKEIEIADKENLKNDETAYRAAEAFYKIGTGNLVDAETAKATMETAKAAYINSKFNVVVSRLALINSIGLPLERKYTFVNTLTPEKLNESLGSLIKKGLEYNPSIIGSEYGVKSQKASLAEAKTGYYPSLNADFSYTGQNSTFPLNRNYTLGISLDIPIFNGFQTRYKVASSNASLNSAIWSSKLTKQNLIYTISQDYYGIKSQALKIKALKQSESASKLAYTLALKSYEVGVGSMVQLVTANSQYISNLTSYINAKYTFYYMQDKLYSDLGLLYWHYFGKTKLRNKLK